VLVMLQWAWSYVTYRRGARLITEAVQVPGAALRASGAPAASS